MVKQRNFAVGSRRRAVATLSAACIRCGAKTTALHLRGSPVNHEELIIMNTAIER
jgi:hypothetical protein